jgi:hypothetical protein
MEHAASLPAFAISWVRVAFGWAARFRDAGSQLRTLAARGGFKGFRN